jgi:hypothetical protein
MKALYLRAWTLLLIAVFLLGKRLPRVRGRDNCATWTVRKFMVEGGAIVFVRSKFGWWLHTQHVDSMGVTTEWEPVDKKRRRLVAPLLFEGAEREGVLFYERVRRVR